jgi:16S rRNA (adenine1518-N6/adenine1519-N6)-dimethyltransferase
MQEELRQTRSYLMRLFESRGLHPRHDLGQNFLIDLNLLDFLVRAAELTEADVVLEVGAGTGSLTAALARQAGHVVSVELDPTLHGLAAEATAACGNVTLLRCDALRNKNHLAEEVLAAVREQLAAQPGRQLKLVANLPYGVATPVVSNLVATDLPWVRIVITIQWELALRMSASPGSAHYGALAVWLLSQCRVRILKRLPPQVFWPRPEVDSAIVRIDPDPGRAAQLGDREFFHDFIRRLFQQRRKALRTVLRGMYRKELGQPRLEAAMQDLSLDPAARAEDLDVPTLVRLAERLRQELSGASPAGDAAAPSTAP